ncbi:hypothetical protein EVAR_101639_1 [Eumeta japonica]|uniref:Reverse transcriptase zinc-binding domain-containing protein n=1 Tax=Eumeta variegata TaxID=151549 RepID=A0A4C2AA80_EUMVA|nr:hypothetical protein EVAR_101639_1 [Eumeta japonica]
MEKWAASIIIEQWGYSRGQEHLKKFLSFDARRAEFALKLDRKNLRLLVGALTGHYTCNKHLHRMELSGTGTCRFCGMEEASMEHLIADCLALGHKRYRIQNAYTIEEEGLLKLH